MKKLTLIFFFSLSAIILMAQVPAGFSYQAVVRNNSGEVVANKTVKFHFSILQNSATGTSVYVETQSKQTNEFGLANLVVGTGTKISGNFDPSAWGNNTHFLKVELDPNNGNTFSLLGTMQLMAVPYAFHAKTVEEVADNSVTSAKIASGAVTGAKIAQAGASTGQALKWNGTTWAPAADETGSGGSNPTGPAGGDLTGTYPNPTIGDGKVTSAKILDGTIATVDLANNAVTEAKIASGAVTGAKIAQGGATNGQVLKWSGSVWQPGDVTTGTSLWQQDGNNIYYNTGKVGIGTSNPTYNLDIRNPSEHISLNLKGTTSRDALIYLDKGSTSRNSAISFRDQSTDKFWVGLLSNNNFRITTSYSSVNGMQITSDGNVIIQTDGHTSLRVKGASDAIFYLDKRLATDWAVIEYLQNGVTQFFTGSFPNSNYRISTDFSTLNGIEITSAGNFNVSGTQTNNNNLNLNKGTSSGVALSVNDKEALWFNGTYFSWGFGSSWNYFARKMRIGGSAVEPGYMLYVDGTAAKSSSGTAWIVSSDERLKDIRGNYTKGLTEIIQLRPVVFSYKENNPRNLLSSNEEIGFIAQEVQKFFPEAVNTGKDGYLDFDIHSINVALVNAIRELKQENDLLKTENREQNSRIERLERLFSVNANIEK